MSELTEEQLTLLQTFRQNVGDILTTDQRKSDAYLLRWLRARDWNVGKAEIMLRNSLEWRKANQMDEILEWTPPEVLRLYYPAGQCGYDKEGTPVLIVPFGRSDIRSLIASANKDNFIRYTYQILEQCIARMKAQTVIMETEVTQMMVIFDMKGLSLSHLTCKAAIDVLLEVVRNYELNFPEILKEGIVVNAPSVFTVLFGIIKPLMTTPTIKKVSIFGHNDEKWKQEILKRIPVNQLPKHWGGTREENDEFCSSLICMGGTVPERYLKGQQPDLKCQDSVVVDNN